MNNEPGFVVGPFVEPLQEIDLDQCDRIAIRVACKRPDIAFRLF